MNDKLNQNMVKDCYNYLYDDIKAWENKKEQALATGTVVGYRLAKMIDERIRKKQEELEYLKYALDNMI